MQIYNSQRPSKGLASFVRMRFLDRFCCEFPFVFPFATAFVVWIIIQFVAKGKWENAKWLQSMSCEENEEL